MQLTHSPRSFFGNTWKKLVWWPHDVSFEFWIFLMNNFTLVLLSEHQWFQLACPIRLLLVSHQFLHCVKFKMTKDSIRLDSSHIPTPARKGKSLVKWGFKHQLDEARFIRSWRSPALKIKSLSQCFMHTLSHSEKGTPCEEAVEMLLRVSLLNWIRYTFTF